MPLLPAGAVAYVAPYGAFLGMVELGKHFPAAACVLFPLRVVVPAALLAWFWCRGAYPELRGHRLGTATLADALVGLAIAALWVVPYLVWTTLPRGEPFNPALLGEAHRGAALGLRLAGFALVTPFVEELFVRSFLLRFAETFARGDFRREPIGRFAWRGFVTTVLWFTFSHAPWEWWVAFPSGIALNAWLYRRRQLMACVIAHAVANGAIWALVVGGPLPLWGFL
jgi:CAAX prenyl protease-like protein